MVYVPVPERLRLPDLHSLVGSLIRAASHSHTILKLTLWVCGTKSSTLEHKRARAQIRNNVRTDETLARASRNGDKSALALCQSVSFSVCLSVTFCSFS